MNGTPSVPTGSTPTPSMPSTPPSTGAPDVSKPEVASTESTPKTGSSTSTESGGESKNSGQSKGKSESSNGETTQESGSGENGEASESNESGESSDKNGSVQKGNVDPETGESTDSSDESSSDEKKDDKDEKEEKKEQKSDHEEDDPSKETDADLGKHLTENFDSGAKIAITAATMGAGAGAGVGAGAAEGTAAAAEGTAAAAEGAAGAAGGASGAAGSAGGQAAGNAAKAGGQNGFNMQKAKDFANHAQDIEGKSKQGGDLIGVVKDKAGEAIAKDLEKNPEHRKIAEELAKSTDTWRIWDALMALLALDFKGAWKNLKRSVKGFIHVQLTPLKLLLSLTVGGVLIIAIIIILILGPTIGGFIQITQTISEAVEYVDGVIVSIYDGVGDVYDSGVDPNNVPEDVWVEEGLVEEVDSYVSEDVRAKLVLTDQNYINKRALLLSQVPNFKSLAQYRRNVLYTAATLVAMNYTYLGCVESVDGKCVRWADCLWYTGGGLDGLKGCVVCDTFVGWTYNTQTGEKIWMGGARQGAEKLLNEGRTTEITKEELMPGDIGWSNGHIGIYAGDGYWYHAAGKAYGVIKGKCPGFTRFARFNLG